MRHRYGLQEADFLGGKHILLESAESNHASSPGQYARDIAAIQARVGQPVTLVLRSIAPYTRDRFVHNRTSFIVPGSQIFLPHLFVDLRERSQRPRVVRDGKSFTAASQVVLLFHLVKHRLDDLPLQQVAQLLNYTPMTLTKVREELEEGKVVQGRREGKTVKMKFLPSRELWSAAEPRLTTPVRRTLWVRWNSKPTESLMAGLSALSEESALADDSLPTIAMFDRHVTQNLKAQKMVAFEDGDEAQAAVQVWKYDPLLLGSDHRVDPLSLYLSLRDSADERVQQAAASLLKNFPW